MSKITVRTAREDDMEEVLRLIEELAAFERAPDAVNITVEELREDGFGPQPAFYCFVAETDGKIEGMALLYQRYSTWKGKTVHLEDLIVREKMRGKGIGSALFTAVIQYGHQKGVRRIEWNVLDWNTPAIAFYKKNGVKILTDWNLVQLDEQGIKNYISKLQ